jgi:hypothetical protein
MAEVRVLSRQELFELVWSRPIRELATEFKLSDVGLAKVCKRYAIPRPERGYWQKLAVGKAPKRPKFPAAPAGVGDEVRFHISDDPPPQAEPVISPEVAEWTEREAANRIVVPEHISRYHPLVRLAKDALKEKPKWLGPDDGWRSSGDGAFPIRVTKPHIDRACRIAQALVTALEARKFRLEYSREQRALVVRTLGEEFKVSLVERQKRIPHVPTPEELKPERHVFGLRKFDDVPSGLLRLSLEVGYHKARFEDGKVPLDDQLNDAVLWMVRMVFDMLRPAAERRRLEEQQRREEELRRWLYQQKCDRFDSAFRAWSAQRERLRFVAVLEERMAQLETVPDPVRDYVAWTRRYVEAHDPLPKFFDALAKDETARYHEFTRSRY